ncbi:MAG TPA: hypothetical protein VIH64_14045, partial [Streptosporangiaceae bacterium]
SARSVLSGTSLPKASSVAAAWAFDVNGVVVAAVDPPVLLRGAERGGCPGRIFLPVDVDRPAGRGAEPEPAHQEGVDLLKHKTSTDLMCT